LARAGSPFFAGPTTDCALAVEAKARDCPRLDWMVLDWNELGKGLYRRLGAWPNNSWEPWRLDGDALKALQD